MFAEEEAALLLGDARDPHHLEDLVSQRLAGRPLEHVLGWADFRGLRIAVADGVFVPRLRTGILVDAALPVLHDGSVVVELCCGTGAVTAALVHEAGDTLQYWASDIDPAAVECARRNLDSRGARVVIGDLFDGLPSRLHGNVDVIVANAPYVPTSAIPSMPTEARDHEAMVALDGGDDGLDVQRRLIADAPHWLAPGGTVLVETSARQAATTAAIMSAVGLTPEVVADDRLDATAVRGVLTVDQSSWKSTAERAETS